MVKEARCQNAPQRNGEDQGREGCHPKVPADVLDTDDLAVHLGEDGSERRGTLCKALFPPAQPAQPGTLRQPLAQPVEQENAQATAQAGIQEVL